MYSMTDLQSYHLSEELLFGQLRSTTEYARNELLYEGPNSDVFRAKDNLTGKMVVLKFLKTRHSDPIVPKIVFREITVLKNLNHENVAKLYEVATAGSFNNLCLVLEHVAHPLSKFIHHLYDGEPMPEDQSKCAARHLLRGLRYLHRNNIAHRDIKVENLMVSEDGILKVIDFGLSRRCSPQNRAVTPQVATRWYKPPEILLESPTHGPEVDIWAAGCVIVELLTNQILFKGESDLQQINLIVDILGKPLPNIWPGVVNCRVYSKQIKLKDQPFNRLNGRLGHLKCGPAIPMLERMFVYDPTRRATANDCLQDDWFQKAPLPARRMNLAPEQLPYV